MSRMCVTVPKNKREEIAFSLRRGERDDQSTPSTPSNPSTNVAGGTPRGAEHMLVRQPGGRGSAERDDEKTGPRRGGSGANIGERRDTLADPCPACLPAQRPGRAASDRHERGDGMAPTD